MTAMRRPPADGLLVLRAANGGPLHPGDTVLRMDNRRVGRAHSLRGHLARAKAPAATLLISRFRGALLSRTVARGHWALGLEMVRVRAGVPLPLPSIPTPPGHYRLHWHALRSWSGGVFLTWQHNGRFGGYQKFRLAIAGTRAGLTVHRITAKALRPNVAGGETQMIDRVDHVTFSATSGRRALGFVCHRYATGAAAKLANGMVAVIRGRTLNLYKRLDGKRTGAGVQPTAAGCVPACAIVILAAALPHRAGVVAAVPLIDRRFQTHLGYVLRTKGSRQRLVQGQTRRVFVVRLLSYGRRAASYYFSKGRGLVAIRKPHGWIALRTNGAPAGGGVDPRRPRSR